MKTKVSGGSDDLIEIDGEINDEIGCYDHKRPIVIKASDGTDATIFYDGEWKIEVRMSGDKYIEVIKSVGDDNDHTDENAKGCAGYSDVLVFDSGLEWIKIKGKTYSRS